MDLLSIASPGTQVDSQSSLTDILQTVIRTVSLMPIHEATDYIYKVFLYSQSLGMRLNNDIYTGILF
jgi:DUF971 family protein